MIIYYDPLPTHLKSNQNYDDDELIKTCHEFLCEDTSNRGGDSRLKNLIIRDKSQNSIQFIIIIYIVRTRQMCVRSSHARILLFETYISQNSIDLRTII